MLYKRDNIYCEPTNDVLNFRVVELNSRIVIQPPHPPDPRTLPPSLFTLISVTATPKPIFWEFSSALQFSDLFPRLYRVILFPIFYPRDCTPEFLLACPIFQKYHILKILKIPCSIVLLYDLKNDLDHHNNTKKRTKTRKITVLKGGKKMENLIKQALLILTLQKNKREKMQQKNDIMQDAKKWQNSSKNADLISHFYFLKMRI